ncbi:DUF397 domain-containing protein [Frankia sp. Mgl5]|uniref:DUF397 domain-containing protein n=1 Tax=Frankia sp. Mgl5 TaxID=2933793 RepID=UPI00200BDA3F|nr:DUF397 domain-containing protein [Frankia sp. Mgl5]MCK9932053.1 DUF397 domain-containing protein [Frankia sp. Mgl5]
MPDPHPSTDLVLWRVPSTSTPKAVDTVCVARSTHLVLIRSSLGRPIGVTHAAWADFVAAVKAGEFDDV